MKTSHEKESAIGIFDSGVGGLTVVNEVIKALPDENIIYFGDTARVPYGSKSKETVTKFSKQIVRFLLSKNVKTVIIACNTASSSSYEALADAFDVPFIEVVRPGVSLCLAQPGVKKVGVIGTERTVTSGAYERYLKQKRPDIAVFSKACPLFVPLAEEGWTDNAVADRTAEIYLRELVEKEIDALILGCTHYPLLKNCIQKAIGDCRIINPAEAAAQDIRRFLSDAGLLNLSEKPPVHAFYASDNTSKFDAVCRLVLGKPCSAEIVDIEGY
ncbi:MAG: glutamate racemase [Clostridiales bacterium]|jgi:glutamate racemase|nr:glutamate racemase [Clostridiales bacterium]